jgi:carbonic anhydrase
VDSPLDNLLQNNRAWVHATLEHDPDFFKRLAELQAPEYLWIGCSDSRVPANEIVGLAPGEIFVHRNVGNVVVHTDLNCLSVLQYAVEVLKVKHVIVCGHYGCGGIHAASCGAELGLIDNWLRHIRDVYEKHETELNRIEDDEKRAARLCELNVQEQVLNVCHTTIVQNAWKNGHPLTVHGWIYGLDDGLVRELQIRMARREDISAIYRLDAE